MSYVSLMIPFVAAYIIWAWRAISPKKMTKINIKKDFDIY
jgi:cytochrome d ubiquinol oxidase subunit II